MGEKDLDWCEAMGVAYIALSKRVSTVDRSSYPSTISSPASHHVVGVPFRLLVPLFCEPLSKQDGILCC